MPDFLLTKTLLSARNILHTIGEVYPGVLMVTDAEARIQWANRAFEELTGYTLEEIAGQRPREFLHGPLTDPATVEMMRWHIHRQEPFECEVVNYHKDGTPYWIMLKVRPVFLEGQLEHWIGTKYDITRTKELESELLREQAEIHESLEHLTQATTNLLNGSRLRHPSRSHQVES